MSKRKHQKALGANCIKERDGLPDQIKKIVKGLYYISETDAEILPFVGSKTTEVTAVEVLTQTENSSDSAIEEREFEAFFARLTKDQDWFGLEEKNNAQRFSALKNLLETNLRDLKVFKIGLIEIKIYVVGLNTEDVLMGIMTKAVET